MFVPFDDDDLEWYTQERDPAFLASLMQAHNRFKRAALSAMTT